MVRAALLEGIYEKGQQVSGAQMQQLSIEHHCVKSRYVVPPFLLKVSQSRTGQVILRLNKTLSGREALK